MKLEKNIKDSIYTLGDTNENGNTVVLTKDRLYFLNIIAGIKKCVYFEISEIELVFFDSDTDFGKKKNSHLLIVRACGKQYPFLLNKKDITEHNLRKLCQLFKQKKKSSLYTMKTEDDLFKTGKSIMLEPENLVKIQEPEIVQDQTDSIPEDIEQKSDLEKEPSKSKKSDEILLTTEKEKTGEGEVNELLNELENMESESLSDEKEEPIKKENSLFGANDKPKKRSSLFGRNKK